MPARLIVAYLLIVLLLAGGGAAIWWAVHNSQRARLKRYYRDKHNHQKP